MSASDSDHNHYTLEQRRHIPHSSHRDTSTSISSVDPAHDSLYHATTPTAEDDLPTLPALTYSIPTHAPAKRPSVSTSFEQYASNASLHGFTSEPPKDPDSADPHDFYRQYRAQYRRGSTEGSGHADIVVVAREDGMTTARHQRKPSPVSARTNVPKLPPFASRNGPRPIVSNSPSAAKSSAGFTRPNPALPSTARNRQTSLKDLVDKFNQTPDEAPPLPNKAGSRSTSATSNPITRQPTYSRNNNPSRSKVSGVRPGVVDSSPRQEQPRNLSRPAQRSKRTNEAVIQISTPASDRRSPSSRSGISNNPHASQSMTDLSPIKPDFIRKPLFGEILALTTSVPDPGYGIPRRRGSEGSMHSPNPMFPDDSNPIAFKVSPSSPTAWYSGVTPSLDGIHTNKPASSQAMGMHRRTRSDFAGISAKPSNASALGTHVITTSPPAEGTPPKDFSGHSKRHSQSRIPVRTRRTSGTSDSGSSVLSARTTSAMSPSPGHRKASSNGTRAAPKPSQKAPSPVRKPISSPPKKSPGRHGQSPARQRPSPLLKAYISAPVAQKSPPLRSSRPRQPVSSASTSASRAKAVERFGALAGGNPSNSRENRPKRLPELGGVDFAARRERIQQAFTKTVQENERKEEMELERRRMSSAVDGETLGKREGEAREAGPLQTQEEVTSDQLDDNCAGRIQEDLQEDLETPAEGTVTPERRLSVNMTDLSEDPSPDMTQDSPTLGIPGRFPAPAPDEARSETPPSDTEPMSAVTAGTTGTAETVFENEPQAEPPQLGSDHHTLLSHVMRMREPSPASPRSIAAQEGTAEDSSSDREDSESIQIMLGDTPVEEKSGDSSDKHEGDPRDIFTNEGPGDRWSTSSWTSSIRDKDRQSMDRDRDAPMDPIDEDLPKRSEESAHSSVSAAASNETPQPWSPATFSSPRTIRTTMDSDAYSTVNRVLDHYHDHLTQSPDLARAGGWDSQRTTRLYLERLARSQHGQFGTLPDPLRPLERHIDRQNTPQGTMEGRPDYPPQSPRSEPASPRKRLEVDLGHLNPQRASLNHPDDWLDTSPSIGDWAAYASLDSPIDGISTPPPKELHYRDGSETPRLSNSDRPHLPELQGTGDSLGLIRVTSPKDDDSPTLPPPPLPNHSPPPLPLHSSVTHALLPPPVGVEATYSPGVYSKHPPSRIYPPAFPGGIMPGPSTNSSGDSFQQTDVVTPSAQNSDSSSHSQQRPSPEHPPISSVAPTKPTSPTPDEKRLTRRKHIIKELVDTEHSFGQDMKVVDDIYRGTSNVLIISAEDVKTLFGNSGEIVAFSTNFVDALKQASRGVYVMPKSRRWRSKRASSVATSNSGNTDDQSSINGMELNDEEKDRTTFIGEAFGRHMSQMEKVYAEYLKNHDAANNKLQALQKNPKVEIWLRECRAFAHDLTTAWDLDSLLVKPVQRILKYPLLLDQLLEVTPENHPDYTALDVAAREMKGVSMRINEMKKRADLMEQVVSKRKRKDSDVRIGLTKAFGRRTEKLRQQVGLSGLIEDREYNAVSEKFGSHFFQLQVVMRDVEMYTSDVQTFMNRFNDFFSAIEGYIDVGQTSYPEIESKWRKFKMSMREMAATGVTDHINAVRKHVVDPMTTLLKLHDGPQRFMRKRDKRLADYARFKAIKDRGDKPDKKTLEQGEQFLAVNDTLKEELPKLFALTGRLVEACLNNFVQLQLQWQKIWRRKLSQAIDENDLPNISDIVESFSGDFAITEAQALALGICNGAMLADAVNLVSFLSPTTLNGDDSPTPHRSSTFSNSKLRGMSISNEASPVLPQPDFGARHSGSFSFPPLGQNQVPVANYGPNPTASNRRLRANSAASGPGPGPVTPEMPGSYRSFSNTPPSNTNLMRPSTSTGRSSATSPVLPRLDVDTPSFNRLSRDSPGVVRPPSGSTYGSAVSAQDPQLRSSSPSARYSGFFSSAMPMSDSPRPQSPVERSTQGSFNVLFLAASVYEFNIDRARREAGYPYLTYVEGELFDVIGEKGELWLAKNQDDSTNQVGWIWNKHFAKLAA
ncbi:MAG: hypothetical protein FRX48_07321 [Lasallia pustulata]|uniref:DH domain-containing protein n=1 Tax=Lasallia pustulata TaxID=136370 RepID=A0A5M8PHW1_9LECA|nr:MAG: hypothetical protein FRX48_07321 [Lasallia pustulata]